MQFCIKKEKIFYTFLTDCRPRKHVRKNNYAATSPNDTNQRRRDSEGSSNSVGVLPHHNIHSYTPVTPLTAEEKETVQQWRVFLPRNLTKVII